MQRNPPNEVRDFRDGGWYWIARAVIKDYAPRIRALGIAVYNVLASLVDKEQSCFPSQRYIADLLGYSRTAISRALKLLEREGLIEVERRKGPPFTYRLLKVGCQPGETGMLTGGNRGVKQRNTNNNRLTKNINNIDNDVKNFCGFDSSSKRVFKPESREELLALDLATSLGDLENLPLYLTYAKQYPESLLRMLLGEVKELPPQKLRKGRAALFNYLLKRYAQGTKDPCH